MSEEKEPDSRVEDYISNLEKQLYFTKTDLSNRPKLYELLVKSSSHGAGASNLKELLTTPNNVLSNEDLRRKVSLIEAEIQNKTRDLSKLSSLKK